MKILTIPDIHGKDTWKKAIDTEWDIVVFTGDYVDDYETSDTDILHNLKEIIQFKKDYQDRVVLLWGNHEPHYLFSNSHKHQCSGFRLSLYHELHHLLDSNSDLFQFSFQINKHLWSHAGVHVGWFTYRFKGCYNKSISEQLNESFNQYLKKDYTPKSETLFDCGYSRGGRQRTGGPLWCDRSEMWEKGLSGYHQIVGHSKVDKIMTCRTKKGGSVTFCDCLDKVEDFYVVEIDE